MAAGADDDMIVQLDAQPLADLGDVAGDGDVLFARAWIAARVVVHQDQAGGAEIERPADHFARVDRRFAGRSLAEMLVADQHVLRVQEQDPNAFDRQMGKVGAQIVEQRLPAVDDRPAPHFRRQQPQRRRLDRFQCADPAVAKPFTRDRFRVGGQQPANAAKLVQQAFRQRFGIPARNGEREHIFDEFMVEERVRAAAQQSLAQSRPVAGAVSLRLRHSRPC